MAESEKNYLTVADFAKALDVSASTVRNWIRAGKVDAIQIGRTIRIPKTELDRVTGSSSGVVNGDQ